MQVKKIRFSGWGKLLGILFAKTMSFSPFFILLIFTSIKMRPIQKTLIFALFFLLTVSAQAQVVTSSLNSVLYRNAPAAASWRFSSSISASFSNGDGENIEGGEKKGDTSFSDTIVGLSQQFENATLQYFNTLNENFKNKNLDGFQYTRDTTSDQLNLAYRFDEKFSLGATMGSIEAEEKVSSSLDSKIGKQKFVGGGFSWRIGKIFYLGAGMNQFKSSKDDKEEESKWNETYYGLSFLNEDKFRLEVSRIHSPKVEKENAPSHAEHSENVVSLEFKFSDVYLLGYTQRRLNEKPIDPLDPDQKTEVSIIEAGYVPLEGVAVVLMKISRDAKTGEKHNKSDIYRLGVSYNY